MIVVLYIVGKSIKDNAMRSLKPAVIPALFLISGQYSASLRRSRAVLFGISMMLGLLIAVTSPIESAFAGGCNVEIQTLFQLKSRADAMPSVGNAARYAKQQAYQDVMAQQQRVNECARANQGAPDPFWQRENNRMRYDAH